jgi:DNA-binding transcriptional MerR regulator
VVTKRPRTVLKAASVSQEALRAHVGPAPGAPSSDACTEERGEPRTGLHTTGDMARITGNTLRTVRFYEEAGVLRPARRTDGGHRLFDDRELERLQLVSDMREAGMSLDDVRSLLELRERAKSGGEAAKTATVALGELLGSLRAKLDVLARLSADIERTVAQAEACAGCAETELFPKRCHECAKLVAKGPFPRGLRVLWGMPAESADGARPAEER